VVGEVGDSGAVKKGGRGIAKDVNNLYVRFMRKNNLDEENGLPIPEGDREIKQNKEKTEPKHRHKEIPSNTTRLNSNY